jgi:hypothetical protein
MSIGLDHVERAAPLAQQLLPEDVGVAQLPSVRVEGVVAVYGLCQINPQPIDVHLLREESRAADELLAHDLLPVARRPAAGAVVYVAAIGVIVVAGSPLVPIVDVLMRFGRVVLPLRPVGLQVVMVVDHVLDYRYAAAVALSHEVLVLVAPSRTGLHHEVVRIAVAPADAAGKLGHGQQFDRVHAQRHQVIEESQRIR